MDPYVIAITGASAQILGLKALQLLLKSGNRVELVFSEGAYKVWSSELNTHLPIDRNKQELFLRKYLKVNSGILNCHKWNDNSASIASGSFKTKAMVIIPSTMGKIGRIASGTSSDLIERSADVHLKESRPLIICPRETPFNLIHLRNLTTLAESGAKIVPPIPSWYSHPESIDDMVNFFVVRLFDLIDINLGDIKRWEGKS